MDTNALSRSFYARIGRLGGLAGRGSAAKQASARKAISIRWRSKKLRLTLASGRLLLSREVHGLDAALSHYLRWREADLKIKGRWESFLWREEGGEIWTLWKLLPAVESHLKANSIEFSVIRKGPQPSRADLSGLDLSGFRYRELRLLKRFLKQEMGALCYCPPGRRSRWMALITAAHPRCKGVIVVDELQRLEELRRELRIIVPYRTIGVLTDTYADDGDLLLMTPAQLRDPVFSWRPGFVVMERVPKKGMEWTFWILEHFPAAKTYGFLGPSTVFTNRLSPFEALLGLRLKDREGENGPETGSDRSKDGEEEESPGTFSTKRKRERSFIYRPQVEEIRSLGESEREWSKWELAQDCYGLASLGAFVGGTSWARERWIGSFYAPSRYRVRGAHGPARFLQDSLREYGSIFPTVLLEQTYEVSPEESLRCLLKRVPAAFQFALRVPWCFVNLHYSADASSRKKLGRRNPTFLNTKRFADEFLKPNSSFAERIGLLMLEFPHFSGDEFASPEAFLWSLEHFLTQLPHGWQMAVEVANAEFLDPSYFGLLHRNRVAHVFAERPGLPSITRQIDLAGGQVTDFTVAHLAAPSGRGTGDRRRRKEGLSGGMPGDAALQGAGARLLAQALHAAGRPSFIFIEEAPDAVAPELLKGFVDQVTSLLSYGRRTK